MCRCLLFHSATTFYCDILLRNSHLHSMAPLNRRLSHSIVEVPAAPLSAPLPSLSASPWSSPFSSLNRTLAHRRAKTKAKTEVVPNPSTPDLANAQDNGLLGGIEEAIKKKESEIELKVDFKQSETRAGRVAMFLRRYLLHDWRDSFNPDNERSYIDAQTKSLRLLMKVCYPMSHLFCCFDTNRPCLASLGTLRIDMASFCFYDHIHKHQERSYVVSILHS